MSPGADPQRILILAPLGRDAVLAAAELRKVGIKTLICKSGAELAEAMVQGAGGALIAEEGLSTAALAALQENVAAQAPWSDFPFVIFGRRLADRPSTSLGALVAVANVTLLERPVHVHIMVSAVRSALRARLRQYEARRAIIQRDNFLAMLGHELRNPLGAVSFSSELLHGRGGLEPAVQRHVEIIRRQVRHLGRLVDDLLDVARITSGKVVLRQEGLDLAGVLQRVVDTTDGAPARVDVDTPGHPVFVSGDPVRLEQIVGNLLGNALKYTPGPGRVRISLVQRGSEAILRVADDGIGIAPDVLPHVFNLFTQADAAIDRSKGGMGIGLTVVKGLIELHGGRVEALSAGLGKGSEFVVHLPVIEQPPPPAQPREIAGQRRARHILVIEDGDDIRETLQEFLVFSGHRAEVAADGPAGLSLLVSSKPEIALVDIGLPGLDGYELARRARRALGNTVRLIALSGYGQPADKLKAHDAGFDDHLTKPVDLHVLLKLLDAQP